MNSTDAAEQFLTAEQCQKLTGIPAATWRYWAHVGREPNSFKLGGRRVWRLSVLLAWIAQQEAKTSSVKAV